MKNFFKALPALVGVLGGILLYVLNLSEPKTFWTFAFQIFALILIATTFLIIGSKLIGRHPRLGMILIEFWVLSTVAITSGCTFFILWISTTSPAWFQFLNTEESKTAVSALIGAITTFFGILFTKDIEDGKGFFFPSYHFKRRMGKAFLESTSMPGGDTKEYDALYEEHVRDGGPIGWSFNARWQRATIMANYLRKVGPMQQTPSLTFANMSNYQSTEVYNYLSYLEHYLSGDLAIFHKICEEAEKKENEVASAITASNRGSMSGGPQQTTSTSTTTQTTKYPGDDPAHYFALGNSAKDIFRLTIPITLTLFATVDCLGYLSGANTDPLRTNENFKEFFKQSTIPVSEVESVFLNQVFRQGLTHVYFPKLGLGISFHSNNPPGKLFFRENGNLILNVNRLEEIVIATFKSVKGNENLYPQMETRYQALKTDYQNKHGNAIGTYAV
jgi:hypothetical protein